MTTPAPPAAAPATSPSDTAADSALVLVLAPLLLDGLLTAGTVLETIQSYSRRSRILSAAMLGVLQVLMSFPPERTGASGSASLQVIRLNALRRSQFAVMAGHRVTSDLLSARSRGETVSQALARALPRERRWFSAHIQASWQRATAAQQADLAALSYGPVLGWYAVHDARTSAECKAADGRNFSVTAMPRIGWPGAVHPHCRCYPGPAHIGARMLPSTYEPARIPVMA